MADVCFDVAKVYHTTNDAFYIARVFFYVAGVSHVIGCVSRLDGMYFTLLKCVCTSLGVTRLKCVTRHCVCFFYIIGMCMMSLRFECFSVSHITDVCLTLLVCVYFALLKVCLIPLGCV